MHTIGDQFAGVLARLGGDKQLFHELIAYFREDAPGLLGAIRTAAASGSKDATARAAHSLRGLVANFDAQEAMALAGSIEQAARKGDFQAMARALDELEIEVDALQLALKGYLSRSAATGVPAQ